MIDALYLIPDCNRSNTIIAMQSFEAVIPIEKAGETMCTCISGQARPMVCTVKAFVLMLWCDVAQRAMFSISPCANVLQRILDYKD